MTTAITTTTIPTRTTTTTTAENYVPYILREIDEMTRTAENYFPYTIREIDEKFPVKVTFILFVLFLDMFGYIC